MTRSHCVSKQSFRLLGRWTEGWRLTAGGWWEREPLRPQQEESPGRQGLGMDWLNVGVWLGGQLWMPRGQEEGEPWCWET